MDSFPFRWWRAARIVAYLDVIFTSLVLLVVIYITSVVGVYTIAGSHPDKLTNYSGDPYQERIHPSGNGVGVYGDLNLLVSKTWLLWVLIVSMQILTLVHLWAAFQLLKATNSGRQLPKAVKQARRWCFVTVFIFAFQVSGLFYTQDYISSVIGIWIRGTFLYIVHKFISEVSNHLISTNSNTAASAPGLVVVNIKETKPVGEFHNARISS